jgi:hypothetical protein
MSRLIKYNEISTDNPILPQLNSQLTGRNPFYEPTEEDDNEDVEEEKVEGADVD